ncbi:hypothetical protein HBI36_229750 [Parastagonospora nodorum]|nr:hypothetical protein HBI36_229750 [Parastagonospora nodorum]
MVKNTRNQQVRGGVALPPVKRARPLKSRYASSNKGTPAPSRTKHCCYAAHLLNTEERTAFCAILLSTVILLSQLLINNRTTLCGTPKTAPLLVRSSIATTPCRSAACQARIEVTAAYALNYLELRVLKLTYGSIGAMAGNQDKFQFLSANMMALVGTVLYNAIKEYHDDGMRKIIHFHGYTVEDNYNAIREKWKRLSEIRHDYHDNDKTIIAQGNEKTTSLLWMSAELVTEETRVRLRESSGEIHDILLREFRGADDFIESVTHNDDEQSIVTDSTWDEFAMLAEEYMIDNRIIHALALTKDEWELEPEDCDALVERYEEEINCSDLYSTV